ncbi:Hypothetical predicted protein [Paramuricea clavata]|uniref:Carboxylic ester hydrolase n=1 Tax=Paramuricea clavata TaxID=317549 RepID=A0A7D9I833_PARCT|nr:Hypothetical predicted protein [Paramuricea clavata]
MIQSSSLSGIRVQKFLNIPYAEAPVGQLRFEKPQPKRPWKNILNSTENLIACIQPWQPGVTITEDCLILNVWTPFPRPQNTSVMVWIHGGAFRGGNSGSYVGSNFVAVGDVILVTINYRLSALGFLTTGDNRIKGNFGLYDQRLAMKWVKENIAYFGGNPKSITIFGQSAGSASVSAHTLSKGSWELFDRAILESGNMLMPWSIMTDSQIKDGLKWFLGKVNCNSNENMLECLQNVTENKWKSVANNKEFGGIWTGPNVDREFISDKPQKIWEDKDVKHQDIIIGNTKDEMFLVQQYLLQKSTNIRYYLNHFEELLKINFKNLSKAVYEKARELYKPKCIPSYLEALKSSVAFESDLIMICGSRQEAKLRSKHMNTTKVYAFQYSHAPLVNYIPSMYPYGVFGFAAHALDTTSVFGLPINDTKFRSDDRTLSMRMLLYWTNFAKTGDPNSGTRTLPIVVDKVDILPLWPQHSDINEEFLDMESFSRMTVRTKLREKHCEFLNDPEGFIEKETSG